MNASAPSMALRPYQQAAVAAVYRHLRQREDHPCVVLPTGCHAAGHPILMYDGTLRRVEEVRVGDEVMGPDSSPRRVLALCRGEDELYRITPHRGEPFLVNGEHILSLVSTNEGKGRFACQRRGGELDQVTVRDYLTRSKSWRHLRKLYRVAVDFADRPCLPIPPYILGLLLGDGSLEAVSTSLTTADDAIARIWSAYAALVGCGVSVRDDGGRCPTYRLQRSQASNNIVTTALDALGLAGRTSATKFIPALYRTASREERLGLLAGLIDSDGCANKSGIDYVTQSRELAGDIVFLARSLGFWAQVTEKYCTCQTGAGGWYFRVSIWGDFSSVPIRLNRRMPQRRLQRKNPRRTGFEVDPAGRGPFYGFVLDGDHLYVDGHFVVHHNSGKTPIIATICRDAVTRWNGRVLVLAHVKELLAQAVDKLHAMAPDLWMQIGVYSAGLNSRDTAHPILIAGIQSVYQKARTLGAFDLVLIDEAHMIPPEGDGMYRRFLQDARALNPHLRVIGLTATPFRMSSGPICVPPPEGILNTVCYEIGVRELITAGYLCPLKSKAGKYKANTGDLHLRGGEFVPAEVEALMDQEMLVHAACTEIVEQVSSGGRRACLIFTSGVKHGQHVAKVIEQIAGEECGFVDGDTAGIFRDQILQRFKDGQLRYLANVNVLTTGFDAPHVDCVALLRPTMSPGLYYQMVGRGFRLAPGKTDCLVLDFGGNVLRHGPVDQIRVSDPGSKRPGEAPAKECPECRALIATGYATCPECGFVFPPPERRTHDGTADGTGVLSGEVSIIDYPVRRTNYSVHVKRDAPPEAPRSLRVDYEVGYYQQKSEWVCLEHTGYARQKAEAWWRLRSCAPVPKTAEEAVAQAEAGALAETLSITVRHVAGEKYERIIDCELGTKPAWQGNLVPEADGDFDRSEPDPEPAIATDDIPF